MDKIRKCKRGKYLDISVNGIIVAYFDTKEKILKVSEYWLKSEHYELLVCKGEFGTR